MKNQIFCKYNTGNIYCIEQEDNEPILQVFKNGEFVGHISFNEIKNFIEKQLK